MTGDMTVAEIETPRGGQPPVAGHPGYLSVRVVDGVYVGALMVTDHTGLPVDFRYTDPVTPTRLQRVLYGGVLDRHLRYDVILRTLLSAVEEAPTLLFADDRRLLAEPGLPCPALVATASAAAPIGPPGTTHAQGGDSRLVQVADGAAPVRITLPDQMPPADAEAVVAALTALGATMDILEPTGRVAEALDLVADGDVDVAPE